MKLGSLFDGSGTCPLAASAVGIIPAWASEIEPFPKAVTQSRFPKMAHLGDITKMNGAEIEPVDVITFSSRLGSSPKTQACLRCPRSWRSMCRTDTI